jgi:hypothetical protein
MSRNNLRILFVTVLLGVAGVAARRPDATVPPAAPGDVVAAANAFLATLDAPKRAAALFPFGSEQKSKWSNLPGPMFQRNGVRLGDLDAKQRQAVHTLLRAALSAQGYQKVLDIMAGDEVLRTQGGGVGGGRLSFGSDNYYVDFLGTPSATEPWMLQFGGHHLALNVTMVGRNSALTPSLPAAQPASFTLEGRLVRPLGDEYDKAFALINALDPSQQKEAILGFAMRDLVLGPGQDGKTIVPEGIKGSRLNASQQAMLLDLAGEWVDILNDEGAAARMAEIRSNLADSYFAWSGPTTKGRAAYFRIQGPTVVIEYAPQGRETGTDQGVDHIHTIYRDPTNDYGARFARR